MSTSSAGGQPAAFSFPPLALCMPPAVLSGLMFGAPMLLPLAASIVLAPPVPASSAGAGANTEVVPNITLAAGMGVLPPPPPLPTYVPAAILLPVPSVAVSAASVAKLPPTAPVVTLLPPPTTTVTLPLLPHVATGSARLTLAATQPMVPSVLGSLPDSGHRHRVVDNGDLKLVGQLTKTVGMLDSRMSDNVPRTKVFAWLNHLESALKLHFGPLGDDFCERLL